MGHNANMQFSKKQDTGTWHSDIQICIYIDPLTRPSIQTIHF